jgi:hypothetical protein
VYSPLLNETAFLLPGDWLKTRYPGSLTNSSLSARSPARIESVARLSFTGHSGLTVLQDRLFAFDNVMLA